MRRPIDRFRVKLGDFWLQGDNGWGQKQHADKLTKYQAIAVTKTLRSKGIRAEMHEERVHGR